MWDSCTMWVPLKLHLPIRKCFVACHNKSDSNWFKPRKKKKKMNHWFDFSRMGLGAALVTSECLCLQCLGLLCCALASESGVLKAHSSLLSCISTKDSLSFPTAEVSWLSLLGGMSISESIIVARKTRVCWQTKPKLHTRSQGLPNPLNWEEGRGMALQGKLRC